MPYPRFTKVINNHFISKDKTISMRNWINIHTVRNDTLLGTLKFVSKTQDYQKYGALMPEEMINQAIKDSKAYKTYLAFATGQATPKKNDDEKEEYKEEYVRTPNNYEFTDDDEEYEELYKDVNVRLTDVEHCEEGKKDAEKTDVVHDDVPLQSSSISSDFATQFINLDNPSPVDTEINSMMNIDVRHEEPKFKKKAQGEKKRYIDLVEKSVKDIIKDEVKSQLPQILPKEVSNYATLVIQSTITESLENVVLAKSSSQPKSSYEAAASLTEFELKKILLDKMQKSKSYRGAQEHKYLYDGLVKSYKLDKDLFESYDQGLKRRKTSKDVEPPKGSKSKESKSSSSKGNKSKPKSSGSDLGNTDDQPNVEVALERDWFKKPERPSTPDSVTDRLNWNNPEGQEYPFDHSKPLPLIKDRGRQVVLVGYFINNDLKYLKGGSSSRKYMTSTTKTKAAKYDNISASKDMVPLFLDSVKKKILNLESNVIFDLNVALWMFTRRVVILKRVEDLQLGVESYQKKLNITKQKTFSFDDNIK
ncbi:hypothetical protein Tco_0536393 [Tanacetum coccineum]